MIYAKYAKLEFISKSPLHVYVKEILEKGLNFAYFAPTRGFYLLNNGEKDVHRNKPNDHLNHSAIPCYRDCLCQPDPAGHPDVYSETVRGGPGSSWLTDKEQLSRKRRHYRVEPYVDRKFFDKGFLGRKMNQMKAEFMHPVGRLPQQHSVHRNTFYPELDAADSDLGIENDAVPKHEAPRISDIRAPV